MVAWADSFLDSAPAYNNAAEAAPEPQSSAEMYEESLPPGESSAGVPAPAGQPAMTAAGAQTKILGLTMQQLTVIVLAAAAVYLIMKKAKKKG